MTPTDLAALVEKLREALAESHRCLVVAKDKRSFEMMWLSVHTLAVVTAGLVDVCVELNDRLPISTEAFGGK